MKSQKWKGVQPEWITTQDEESKNTHQISLFEEKKRKTILYFTVEANEMQEMVWEKGAVSSAVTGLKPTNFYT